MSGFEDKTAVLWASRVLGSVRQLWSDDETPKAKSYELRPELTRSQHGLADLLATKDVTGLLEAVHQEPMHITSEWDNVMFDGRFRTDADFVPLLLEGCADGGIVSPKTQWNLAELVKILGSRRRLEVAQADATVSVHDFVTYLTAPNTANDDDPVLVFETLVDDEHDCMINRFSIPPAFWGGGGKNKNGTLIKRHRTGCHAKADTSDLLSASGLDGLAFGLHRWMILGPKNSGSNLHIDPLGTSAWNMLLMGRKLWVLFPPNVNENVLKSKERVVSETDGGTGKEYEDFCASGWFSKQLSKIALCHQDVYAKRVQFVQHPGETVFVPEGWWHAVLNLDTTFAVTQNFGHPHSIAKVASALAEADPTAFKTWRRNIKRSWKGSLSESL